MPQTKTAAPVLQHRNGQTKNIITCILPHLARVCKVCANFALLGCGLGARMMGFQTYDAISIGLGMVSRGEVALIVAQKGAQAGLIDANMFPPIVLVVIVTTLITPILLKIGMRRQTPANTELSGKEAEMLPNTERY